MALTYPTYGTTYDTREKNKRAASELSAVFPLPCLVPPISHAITDTSERAEEEIGDTVCVRFR